MDGAANPSQLPPVQTQMGQPPPPPGAFIPGAQPQQAPVQQNGPGRPPGRPNSDPEANIDRERKHKMRNRLDSILPNEMTDGRIAVYRLQGKSGKVRQSTRPLLTIMFKDLEAAAADGIQTGDFVREKISDKFGTEGRFLWLAQDHRGRPLTEYGEVEVNLGTDEAMDEGEDPEDEIDDPVVTAPPRDTRIPPPPAPWNPATYVREIKDTLSAENNEKQSQLALMMSMMTNSTNMQLAAAREQREQDAVRRQEEDRRREREEERDRLRQERDDERRREEVRRQEKEEDARRDREREDRRADAAEKAALLNLMLNRPDTMTPMLMKMLDSKSDRDGTKEMFAMMGENTRQQMMTQGEATKHLMGTQAEAAKLMISNVMDISQKMVAATLEAQQPGDPDDPMDKIGKVFNMLRPVLGAIGSSPPPVLPAPQPQQQHQQQQQPVPARRAAQPSREANPTIPDSEWTKGCLYTIMRLETGEIPVSSRLDALAWTAKNLPPTLAGAIKAGDKDKIKSLGAEGLDDVLMAWIMDEKHVEFMERCLADIQRMLVRAWDRQTAKASIDYHVAYQKAKGVTVETPPVAETVEEVEEPAPASPVADAGPKKRSAPLPANMQLAEALPEKPETPAEGAQAAG